MMTTKTKRLFIFVLFFLFSVSCREASAGEKGSEIRLVDSWKSFFLSYRADLGNSLSVADVSAGTVNKLESLVYELSLVNDADFYMAESGAVVSGAALSIKNAYVHAKNALESVAVPEKFRQECFMLIYFMNDYLLCTVESNRTYLFQFVELLTIISLLSVTFVFGGIAWVKNRHKMETLAEQYRQEHLVTATITKVQESERNRISHDLHDTVTQDIRTALMFVHKLDNSDSLTEEQRAIVSKIKQLDEQNMRNIRNIIRNLTPPEIETSNFMTLLAEFSSGIEESNGIPCKFYAEESRLYEKLTADQKLHVFRIVQEGVNNAVKHSGASEISVIVREECGAADSGKSSSADDEKQLSGSRLVFIVSDDGCGIAASKRNEAVPADAAEKNNKDDIVSVLRGGTHLGLSGMKSRATMLGATLEIKSDSEIGTLIKLTLPM